MLIDHRLINKANKMSMFRINRQQFKKDNPLILKANHQ